MAATHINRLSLLLGTLCIYSKIEATRTARAVHAVATPPPHSTADSAFLDSLVSSGNDLFSTFGLDTLIGLHEMRLQCTVNLTKVELKHTNRTKGLLSYHREMETLVSKPAYEIVSRDDRTSVRSNFHRTLQNLETARNKEIMKIETHCDKIQEEWLRHKFSTAVRHAQDLLESDHAHYREVMARVQAYQVSMQTHLDGCRSGRDYGGLYCYVEELDTLLTMMGEFHEVMRNLGLMLYGDDEDFVVPKGQGSGFAETNTDSEVSTSPPLKVDFPLGLFGVGPVIVKEAPHTGQTTPTTAQKATPTTTQKATPIPHSTELPTKSHQKLNSESPPTLPSSSSGASTPSPSSPSLHPPLPPLPNPPSLSPSPPSSPSTPSPPLPPLSNPPPLHPSPPSSPLPPLSNPPPLHPSPPSSPLPPLSNPPPLHPSPPSSPLPPLSNPPPLHPSPPSSPSSPSSPLPPLSNPPPLHPSPPSSPSTQEPTEWATPTKQLVESTSRSQSEAAAHSDEVTSFLPSKDVPWQLDDAFDEVEAPMRGSVAMGASEDRDRDSTGGGRKVKGQSEHDEDDSSRSHSHNEGHREGHDGHREGHEGHEGHHENQDAPPEDVYFDPEQDDNYTTYILVSFFVTLCVILIAFGSIVVAVLGVKIFRRRSPKIVDPPLIMSEKEKLDLMKKTGYVNPTYKFYSQS